jgi:hypothetical protein
MDVNTRVDTPYKWNLNCKSQVCMQNHKAADNSAGVLTHNATKAYTEKQSRQSMELSGQLRALGHITYVWCASDRRVRGNTAHLNVTTKTPASVAKGNPGHPTNIAHSVMNKYYPVDID